MKNCVNCPKTLVCILLVAMMAMILTGCGGGDTSQPEQPVQTVAPTEEIPTQLMTEPPTEAVSPDFCESPGEADGFIHSYPLGTTVRYDLNGDGIGEDITVDAREYDQGTLRVGDVFFRYQSISPTGYFSIVNVDRNVNVLLIGVSDYGFSDDSMTVLYGYDGQTVTEVGYYEDVTGRNEWGIPGAVCDGEGSIIAKVRLDVLGTWEAFAHYRMESGVLKDVTDFYRYVTWEEQPDGWKVTAKADIIMFGDIYDSQTQTVIPAGTALTMTGVKKGMVDGTYWACFETENGTEKLWMSAELVEWYTHVPTTDGFIPSEEAFDGFFYAG